MYMSHRLTGVLCAVSLLLVTGCGGASNGGTLPAAGIKPTPAPTSKSSASPAPSASPSGTPTPAPTLTPAPTPTPLPTPTPATVMYVADYNASDVYVYSTGGTPALLRTLTTNINNPDRLAVDSKGTLYVINNSDGRVVEYPAGATTPSTNFYSGFPNPVGIAVASDGTIYVSSGTNAGINVFKPGSTTVNATVGLDITSPFGVQGVTLDQSGNLYVVGYASGVATSATVFMIAGGMSTTSTDLQIQGLANPNTLAFDKAGDLVLADAPWAGTSAVDFFAPGSKTMSKQITTGLYLPAGIAFDSADTLWVPSMTTPAFGSGYVNAYPSGATSPTITINGVLQSPTAIAFGPAS